MREKQVNELSNWDGNDIKRTCSLCQGLIYNGSNDSITRAELIAQHYKKKHKEEYLMLKLGGEL